MGDETTRREIAKEEGGFSTLTGLGASDGVYTEILSGLKKGEEILVEVPAARPHIPFF